MKIAIISNVPESLRGFRGQLIQRLCRQGHEVHTLAAEEHTDVRRFLADCGARFDTYPLQRQQTNPLFDLRTCFYLYRWLLRERPDLVLAYTSKPVIWGGIAARFAGVRRFNALITGLGNQFNAGSIGARALALLVTGLYRTALRRAEAVIFQNQDDLDRLCRLHVVRADQAHRVRGSGVDLTYFCQQPFVEAPPVFLTVSRLIGAKGLREFAAAAHRIRIEYPETRFKLVGPFERGADALGEAEVWQWHDAGILDYVGPVDDARAVMAACHVYVLASYYGEGLPRTLLEAMAVGRPILTTDNVGCRELVVPGVNGLCVEARNTDALVQGMRWLLCHRDQWATMGSAGRRMAEAYYDVNRVNTEMLKILELEPSSQAAELEVPA